MICKHFLLAKLLQAGLLLDDLVIADGSQEWVEMEVEVFRSDSQVPVEEVEKLLLHEVDFSDGEAKVGEVANGCVTSPVLVLWRRVVEVLGREDKGCKEDTVYSTLHALVDWRKSSLQSSQVDE